MIDRKKQWKIAVGTVAILGQLSAPALAASYVRDMFYQQLKEPSAPAPSSHSHSQHHSTNTGISFWIELKRNGRTSKVDSRTHFRGGDRIKFHITPNIDGYAHIVMLQGSSGKQEVLFPVQGKDPTNQVKRGRDYAIPSVTYLQFDNTPGREHVRIALTRRDEDPAKFLSPQAGAQLAMAQISPNPAIDPTGGREQIKISFKEDIPKPVPVTRPASAPPPVVEQPVTPPSNDTPISNAIPDDDKSKDLFREDSGSGGGHSSSSHAYHPSHHSYHPTSHAAHHYSTASYRPPTTYMPPPPPPSTVVLNTNANEDLYADISLEHD